MDTYQFVSALVDSLAWPVAAVTALFLLRKPLVTLLGRVKAVKSGDHSIEFAEVLLEAKASAAEIKPPPVVGTGDPDQQVYLWRSSPVDLTPEYFILNAWAAVEEDVFQLAKTLGWEVPKKATAWGIMRRLEGEDIIDGATASVLAKLRHLRNIAAHPSTKEQLDFDQVQEYQWLANRVRGVLKEAERRRKAG